MTTGSTGALSVTLCRDPRQFAALEEPWNRLFRACPTATPFQSHAWLHSWWLSYGRRGRLIISDYLVVVAWIFFVTVAVLDTFLFKFGLFDGSVQAEVKKWGPSVGLATKKDTILALKLIFAETTLYYCTDS